MVSCHDLNSLSTFIAVVIDIFILLLWNTFLDIFFNAGLLICIALSSALFARYSSLYCNTWLLAHDLGITTSRVCAVTPVWHKKAVQLHTLFLFTIPFFPPHCNKQALVHIVVIKPVCTVCIRLSPVHSVGTILVIPGAIVVDWMLQGFLLRTAAVCGVVLIILGFIGFVTAEIVAIKTEEKVGTVPSSYHISHCSCLSSLSCH